MNFCSKKINGLYRCLAPTAAAQKLCEHNTMETWECFCQWCDNGICGLGASIFSKDTKNIKEG